MTRHGVQAVMLAGAVAVACDVIRQGAAMLGWELDMLLDKTLQAMRATEADVQAAMALNPHLQVFVCHGWYDMVTPYFSSDRIIKMLTVKDGELMVEEKGIYSVEKFLVSRRLM